MILLILAGVSAVGAIAALARGIDAAIAHEERYHAALPPAPDEPEYTLPHQWGGPSPTVGGDEVPDLVPVAPRRHRPSPASPEGHHPITQPGSAILVMREPDPITQPSPDITALLAGCPYPLQGPYSSDEFALFSHLKTNGGKQTDIIQTMWGACKGGTEKYQTARDRYMALLKTYVQTRQALGA